MKTDERNVIENEKAIWLGLEIKKKYFESFLWVRVSPRSEKFD